MLAALGSWFRKVCPAPNGCESGSGKFKEETPAQFVGDWFGGSMGLQEGFNGTCSLHLPEACL